MKIAVIGAGISGLSIAKMLVEKGHEVIVYEKDRRPGGMIKCDRIEGSLFHRTGGHVFNTHVPVVADWFWSHFDKEREFEKLERKSVVLFDKEAVVGYPIENHVYQLGDDILQSFIADMIHLSKQNNGTVSNFKDFLCRTFGNTLFDLYFQPYNEKIWHKDLKNVPLSWLSGKFPMPSAEEMLFNNIRQIEEKKFVHSSFYYPIIDGSQFIVDRLSEGLNITCKTSVDYIEQTKGKWFVNGLSHDAIVYCGNIKSLPSTLFGLEFSGYYKDIEDLQFHGTTSVFCEISKNDYTWVYLPSKAYAPHRIICTGNLASSNNMMDRFTGTIEITDSLPKDMMLESVSRVPSFSRYLTHHYEKYTYPIQDMHTREMVSSLKSVLFKHNFYLCGRFAEWEYYNMDMCMNSAINIASNPFFI